MKVLFVCSGNSTKGKVNPLIQNQGDSLVREGVDVNYYLIEGKGLKGYIKNIAPLRRKIKSGEYNVIHAHYSLSAFVASLAGARNLMVSLMGSDVKSSKSYKSLIFLFCRIFRWKYVIVKSDDMFASLGMQNALVIPNGVNFERFRAKDKVECQKTLGWDCEKKHILFPSNPERKEKNFMLLEQAVTLLCDSNIQVHTLVDVPNSETPIWYNAADVVVMTSLWEGSPNAIKEAMACCRPIVATNVGDIEKVTQQTEGCFVCDFDAQQIADSIKQAIKYNNTIGSDDIAYLDSRRVANQIIKLYKD